jgi:dipeptidyl aminopeptidase/acylaminoacyl peptidase
VPVNDEHTLFHDLAAFMAIPRVNSVRVAPDGSWLAAAVQTLSTDKKKWVTSIWRIDASGGEPTRLTRSAEGEGNPKFLPDGGLLFVSKRPDPAKTEQDDKPALWLLPPGGGEAYQRTALPGGIVGLEVAAHADTVVVSSPVLPAAEKTEDDEKLRKRRKDAGVSAILHETVPIRFWDHDLGPAELRLFAVEQNGGDEAPRDLTPDAGRAFFEQSFDVSPDGGQVVTGWMQWQRGVDQSYSELVLIDPKTGTRRTLASDAEFSYGNPAFAPDGARVVAVKQSHSTPEHPQDQTLVIIDVESGDETEITPGFDSWPSSPVWSPDGTTVYFTADEGGRHPVFATGADGQVRRLTGDDGAYLDVQTATDGTLYALRAPIDEPPTPVRIDPSTGEFTRLKAPGTPLPVPGHLTEFTATADDGHPIQSWLMLPDDGNDDHPLVLWAHGGPMMSWNSWSWRWNPWLLVAQGYAVLMPNPALSTGFGQEFVQRAYHDWGDRAFRDIMAATDEAIARDDIDGTRTAMMGGSYGGYMANWIAGHTDRFDAIVSHAGLWVLDQMFGTTDMPMFWRPQFGDPLTSPEMYERNSPHHHLDAISTPMLVIHGDKDYRVPIGEALRLWWDLNRTSKDAKFLYFPDENHWILTPGNHTVWYETVYAFLGQHVLGEEWRRPELL